MGMTPEEAFAQALGASKSYTKKSIAGAGAIKGDDGKSAYEIAVDNGFEGTEEEWLASLKGEPGEDATPYDDTELREDIADIWKAQGELGAKNLLVYPYSDGQGKTTVGITFTVNNDGSITINGTTGNGQYAVFWLENNVSFNINDLLTLSTSEQLPRNVSIQENNNVYINSSQQTVDFTVADGDALRVKLVIEPNTTIDNLTIYPMLRLASDPDDTWQPYAPTNRELYDNANAQLPIIGEYLPTTANGTVKKYSAAIGATTATFNASAFMSKYNATSSDLNLDISAETSSGNVVAYNSVSINSSGVITITFDELTEAATFVCKCSKIQ